MPPDVLRKGREFYYGLVQWLDEQIGTVLGALERSGMADNTIVIYASDHGELMGDHGLWWKNAMYQGATRVPLIVSWPSRWKGGQRRNEVCSLLDLNRTISGISSAKAPRDWNGDSMIGWLDDPCARWKDCSISEYYGHYVASGYAMIRTGQYKYVYHTPPDSDHRPEHELYDLENDPGEFTNLWPIEKHRPTARKLHDRLVDEIGEHPDDTEKRCLKDFATPYERPAANEANPS